MLLRKENLLQDVNLVSPSFRKSFSSFLIKNTFSSHFSHPAPEEDGAVVPTEPGHAAAQPRARHAAYGHQDLGADLPYPDVHIILVTSPALSDQHH